jgi:hypothetical protein
METGLYRAYDSSYMKLPVCTSDSRFSDLSVVMWYFMIKWLFQKDELAHLGAYLTIQLIESADHQLSYQTYGDQSMNKSIIFGIMSTIDESMRRAKPRMYSFGEECSPPNFTFSYSESEFFQMDGSQAADLLEYPPENFRLRC